MEGCGNFTAAASFSSGVVWSFPFNLARGEGGAWQFGTGTKKRINSQPHVVFIMRFFPLSP